MEFLVKFWTLKNANQKQTYYWNGMDLDYLTKIDNNNMMKLDEKNIQ